MCRMLKKEFLQGRILQPMWLVLVMVQLWFRRIFVMVAVWTMGTGSTKDTQKAQSVKRTRESQRKRSERSSRNKRKWKRWRLCCTILGCAVAAASFSPPDNGCPTARGHQCTHTSRWTTDGPTHPFEKSWPGGQPRGGGFFGQKFGKWTSGYKACLAEIGSFWQDSCQVEGRVGSTDHQLEQVPETIGTRIRRTKEEVQREEISNPGRPQESGGGISSCTRSSTGSCCGKDSRPCLGTCTCQGGREESTTGIEWHTQAQGQRFFRRGSLVEEAPHPRRCDTRARLPEQHAEDGFLIGRHDSCYNVHVKGPRFFSMVEVLFLDENSPPEEAGQISSEWWNLNPSYECQTIPRRSAFPTCSHTYGARQAEYVAQLMRIDVETDQFNEAFSHCLWDETMDNLLYLDQIEKASRCSIHKYGIQQPNFVRQIEGSMLWTLLALDAEAPTSGNVDWHGTTLQHGPLSRVAGQDLDETFLSLEGDCQVAAHLLAQQDLSSQRDITVFSYGHFDFYQGVRTIDIPFEHLHHWKRIVRQQWADFGDSDNIVLHVAVPQPDDAHFGLHVVARFQENPEGHNFILVDKVDESPQAESERSVLEVSHIPNGYEVLLTAGIDLHTVTSRTILKHEHVIWQHHQTIPLQDGQFWRILPEASGDETTLTQLPVPRVRTYHPHVLDLWCDGWNNLGGIQGSVSHQEANEDDSTFLMQRSSSSAPQVNVNHQFFRLDGGPFRLTTPHVDDTEVHTLVENHLQLPNEGPHSIRTLHWVSSPPQLMEATDYVHIIETRGDAELRLMNTDVLCLFLLTIEHPHDVNDYSERFRVLWTPHIASRERILMHLRAADICRERTCHLSINHIPWRESDSVIKHFKDADFVHLRILVQPGSSVIATRCDIQGYEDTERHRRVFTNTTSSEETDGSLPQPSTARSRSRSHASEQEESEEELPRPMPSRAPELDDTDQDSLLQISVGTPRPTISLSDLIPTTTCVECDFTPVRDAQNLINDLPWILGDFGTHIFEDSPLGRIGQSLQPWRGEVPLKYHLYTDGSFLKTLPAYGGCGVLLIVTTPIGQLCGGVLSRTCLPAAHSHSAESIAMLWATLIAVQLSHHHRVVHHCIPFHLEFGFDAQVTGQQCAGTWTSFRHPLIQRLCRALIYIVQFRHGFHAVEWTHIRAHQGHFWNEIVDLLAKNAIQKADMVQTSDLLYAFLEQDQVLNAFDWIWSLELMDASHPSMPSLFENHMYHFRHPVDEDVSFAQHFGDIKEPPSTGSTPTSLSIKLQVATFNVLTLDVKKNRSIGTGTSGRHLALMQQCHEKGLHVVGVQETRTSRVLGKNNPYYHIISAPCRQDGHYGIQLWLHRQLPFSDDDRAFQDEDFRILWTTPNVLAVRVLHPSLRCIIIVARGPTGDKAPDELQAFWDSISQRVLDKFPRWKVVLLCDSNAHVGSCPSSSISNHGAQVENAAGEIFHTWLIRHGLWLPSTWSHIHQGDHSTYLTPDGQHQHRLDFVGLSHNWPLDFVATHVAYDLDGSLTRCDHFAVVCSLGSTSHQLTSHHSHRSRKPKLDRDAAARLLRQQPRFFADMAWIPWYIDVHHHARDLATATSGSLHSRVPFARYHRRKRHLQDLTWSLVNWKRQLRKHQIDGSRRLKYGLLREIFVGWREHGRRPLQPAISYARWLKQMHIKLALLDYNLKRVQPIVQQMIRADDAHYYKQLAMKAGRIDHEDGLQGLWKEVRGTLPKWKARGSQQRHEIDDALCQHFAQLEAGQQMPFETLYRTCVQFQNQVASSTSTCQLHLQDLPTLFEIEQTCRKTTPARAAGLDEVLPEICRHGAPGIAHHLHNMIFKIACSQAEPIWYKGGLIHPIYKMKGAMDDPTSYRGVVLLDVFGKKFHAWLRSRLLPLLQARRSPGQLGGLPHEQTLTGAHLLRVHGQVARSMHVSSAVVFVDVRAAFHHMLRELIFLCGRPGLVLDDVLDSEHFDLEALRALLHERCSTFPQDFPVPLRLLADDVHRHTWFTQTGTSMAKTEVMATVRGTRPGSPVADIGFNLLMSDILQDLHERLDGDAFLTSQRQGFPISIPPITWVDDLAVPAVALHPQDLEMVLQRTLQHVHGAFYSKGLQINYDKGKTEAVLMFRGSSADTVRRSFFQVEHETFLTTSTDTHVFRVRAVPSYKHLGIRYQMDSDLEHEVSCRIGQARTAFHEVKRPIFKNEFLTHRTRIQLMQSLVLSKMLYGCGTWYEIPRRTVQKLESTIMRFFRSILNCGFWNETHTTDDQLRARHGLPSFRVLLATSRLRYLAHVASHAHDYHRDLLYEERKYNKGWLYEVEDDLVWMKTCISLPDLPDLPTSHDTWPPFLQWLKTTITQWKSWVKRATLRLENL